MWSRFHPIWNVTDWRTHRIATSILRVNVLMRNNKTKDQRKNFIRSCGEGLFFQSPVFVEINNNNNNNIIISKTMFMVLSSWQSHCESSPGSFDECRTVPSGRRLTTKPGDFYAVSLPIQASRIYTHHRHLLLLSPKADTDFTVPQRVEGWVDLAGWLHTEMVYPSTDGHPSWY